MKLPTVLNLDGPVVIFGGGSVALRKVEYLSKFTRDISVVAEDFLPMPEHVSLHTASLKADDIPDFIPENTALVVAALSDSNLNRAIAEWCRDNGILVNVVDGPRPSTVLFPALSHGGELNIAVSTSGKCPFLARKIREELDVWIKEKERWLEVLAPVREKLVGMTEKNQVLSMVYGDPEVARLVKEGNTEGAKKKAWEVYDVHRKH